MNFSARFDAARGEVVFAGVLRPQAGAEIAAARRLIEDSAAAVSGTLVLNFKRLEGSNNIAFRELAVLLKALCARHQELSIRIVVSSVVAWAGRKFEHIRAISPRIRVEHYDRDFYPGQDMLEDGDFLPILRLRTALTWPRERELLARLGLKKGMAVADICCGLGDFALLVKKEFGPGRLVALDHARASLTQARQAARKAGVRGIEYIYGEASALFLEEGQFDFVACRHALQTFNEPERILSELLRICKPGGLVYLTSEMASQCVGEPGSQAIAWTYGEVARLWRDFEMDIDLGPKCRRLLMDAGFEDVRVEAFVINNGEGNAQNFAALIAAWEAVYAGKMAVARGADEAFLARFRLGFEEHIRAALDPKGFAGWPLWVAWARKPAIDQTPPTP